jgi:hypothetical protein
VLVIRVINRSTDRAKNRAKSHDPPEKDQK